MTITLQREDSRFFEIDGFGRALFATYAILYALAFVRWCLSVPAPDPVLEQVNGLRPSYNVLMFSSCFFALTVYMAARRMNRTLTCLLAFVGFFLISTAFTFTAQFTVFYLGRDFDLVGKVLASIDTWLCFNWAAYLDFVCNHEIAYRVLLLSYRSAFWQPIVLSLILAIIGSYKEFFSLNLAFSLAFLVVCIVAIFFPALEAHYVYAEGVKVSFAPVFSGQLVEPLRWVREAVAVDPNPSFKDLRVITFPSFHAAMALIFIVSAWRIPFLKWGFLALNFAMLAATPPLGSHYLTDVICGALVGLVGWMLSERVLRRYLDEPH